MLKSNKGRKQQSLNSLATKYRKEEDQLKIEKNKRNLFYFTVKLLKGNQLQWIYVFLLSENLFKSG